MLHPSIDIENDFIEKVLKDYGQVKMWFPRRDTWTKIKTGEYIFIMKEEELKVRPIPRQILFNDRVVNIHYNSQPMICFQCGRVGHKARECEFPYLDGSKADLSAKRTAEMELQEQEERLKAIEMETIAHQQSLTGDGPGKVGIGDNDKVQEEVLEAGERPGLVVPVDEVRIQNSLVHVAYDEKAGST